MSRNLSTLRQLKTAADIIDCLNEDPLDRICHYSTDLTPEDFDEHGMALRSADSILTVCSMRATGASTIDEYVNWLRGRDYSYSTYQDEIAVVAEDGRDRFGRIIPKDILKLLTDAEERTPNRLLAWVGYEGLCVLSSHPLAESE